MTGTTAPYLVVIVGAIQQVLRRSNASQLPGIYSRHSMPAKKVKQLNKEEIVLSPCSRTVENFQRLTPHLRFFRTIRDTHLYEPSLRRQLSLFHHSANQTLVYIRYRVLVSLKFLLAPITPAAQVTRLAPAEVVYFALSSLRSGVITDLQIASLAVKPRASSSRVYKVSRF